MEKLLEKMCKMMKELFFKSFGQEDSSFSDHNTLPVDSLHKWQKIITMSKPGILDFRNADAANQLEYTWNELSSRGFIMDHGDVFVKDSVSGILYARSVDPTLSCDYEYNFVSIRDTE